jgi:hypothetical protein
MMFLKREIDANLMIRKFYELNKEYWAKEKGSGVVGHVTLGTLSSNDEAAL